MPQTLLTQEPATAPRKRCAKKRAPPSQGGWAYLPLITSTALAGIPKDGPTGHTDTLAVHIFSALNSSVEELGTARLVCRSWAQAVGSVPLTLTLTGFRDIAAGPRGTSPHPRGWQRTFRGVDSLVLDVDDKQRAFQVRPRPTNTPRLRAAFATEVIFIVVCSLHTPVRLPGRWGLR